MSTKYLNLTKLSIVWDLWPEMGVCILFQHHGSQLLFERQLQKQGPAVYLLLTIKGSNLRIRFD